MEKPTAVAASAWGLFMVSMMIFLVINHVRFTWSNGILFALAVCGLILFGIAAAVGRDSEEEE